jgi:putative MATE family efflux protein
MTTRIKRHEPHNDRIPALFTLTWPILIELALHMLMGNVDTFMLSQYDDRAVAAVGVSNQIANMMNLLFSIVATGTTILISRRIGAQQKGAVTQLAASSLTMNMLFGILLSGMLLAFGDSALRLMGLEDELMPYAWTYLSITGGFIFLQALILTASAVIKSHGFTKNVMFVTVTMNIVNMIGNYIAIKGPLGLPVTGVTGVAVSTVVSRSIGLALMLFLLLRILEQRFALMDFIRIRITHVRELLGIGIPSAGEQLSYNLSQLVITSFIATIGVTAMVTRVYTLNIIFLITIVTIAISQGTQIIIARMIGAMQFDSAYRRGIHSLGIGVLICVALAGAYNILGTYILDLFTDNEEVIALGRKLLLLAFLLEPGRALNLIVISSLRAAGDVRYPVYIGMLFVWLIAVPCAYLFGIHWEMGLIGIFSAFVMDEWLRGLMMLHRWRTKRWATQQQTGGSHS